MTCQLAADCKILEPYVVGMPGAVDQLLLGDRVDLWAVVVVEVGGELRGGDVDVVVVEAEDRVVREEGQFTWLGSPVGIRKIRQLPRGSLLALVARSTWDSVTRVPSALNWYSRMVANQRPLEESK